MKDKINVAELLKDCPKGMELDCTIWDNVTFECVDDREEFSIIIRLSDGCREAVTDYGCYSDNDGAKCVIFPKGKTTWEGFHRPFKDGDILYCNANDDGEDKDMFKYIFIFDKIVDVDGTQFYYSHCHLFGSEFYDTKANLVYNYSVRFATEEEKIKLFQVIKDNGYKWNPETKTLEKLVEPQFKVGDRIILKDNPHNIPSIRIKAVTKSQYILENEGFLYINSTDEKYVLDDRFDITTLKPFDKVLVRNTNKDYWRISMFGYISKGDNQYFMCVANSGFYQCVPYKKNEHLLGTTDDCEEHFKTWK